MAYSHESLRVTGRARVRAAVTTQLPFAGVQAGEFRRRSRATTAYTARRAATRRKGAWSPNASRRRSVVNAANAVPPRPAPNTPNAVPRRCGGNPDVDGGTPKAK